MSGNLLGIAGGLVAAFMQSVAYLFGRKFINGKGTPNQLLFSSLIITGAMAVLLIPFFIDWQAVLTWRMAWKLCVVNGGLLVGHWGFFSAQKYIESSRIASLMGLKIILVMLLVIIFVHRDFSCWQYMAVFAAAFAAVLMNWSKGRLDWNGMGFLLFALLGYAVSDLGIQLVVDEVRVSNPIESGMRGFTICYSTIGIAALLAVKPCRINWQILRAAMPQSLCWIVSMGGLYVCFGLLGAAFGNVVQASRGVISLVLGIVISYLCANVAVESKQSTTVWVRRGIAALLMFGAIVMYALTAKG